MAKRKIKQEENKWRCWERGKVLFDFSFGH